VVAVVGRFQASAFDTTLFPSLSLASTMSLVFFYLHLFVLALAGHAFALNFTIGTAVVQPKDLLVVQPGPYVDACAQTCMMANMTLTQTTGDENTRLCTNSVGMALQQCEQCMFSFIIDHNMKVADANVGSTGLLKAFVSACQTQANVTLNALALTLPASWDGPFVAVLPLPATAIVVSTGALLGATLLYIMCNLD